jgi:hypothetical protein
MFIQTSSLCLERYTHGMQPFGIQVQEPMCKLTTSIEPSHEHFFGSNARPAGLHFVQDVKERGVGA